MAAPSKGDVHKPSLLANTSNVKMLEGPCMEVQKGVDGTGRRSDESELIY